MDMSDKGQGVPIEGAAEVCGFRARLAMYSPLGHEWMRCWMLLWAVGLLSRLRGVGLWGGEFGVSG